MNGYLIGTIGGEDSPRLYEPRQDKPGIYMLYVDDKLIDGYGSAYKALEGLRYQSMTLGQKIEIRDEMGERLAEKNLVQIEGRSSALPVTYNVPQLLLSDNIRRDLVAEKRDPLDPFSDREAHASVMEQRGEIDVIAQLRAMSEQLSQVQNAQHDPYSKVMASLAGLQAQQPARSRLFDGMSESVLSTLQEEQRRLDLANQDKPKEESTALHTVLAPQLDHVQGPQYGGLSY